MFCERQTLYTILPYFNYCDFERRRTLFIEFVKHLRTFNHIRIVVVELVGATPLPKLRGVYKHIKFPFTSPIWIKENLINLGVHALPSSWTHVAWIDADITFLNATWVQDTFDELSTHDIVQMFHTCVNLGPREQAFKVDKSFAYMSKDSGTPFSKTDRYGFWHPGYAWACTRAAWTQMDGLIEWAILGSADRHMSYALIGKVLDSAPTNIHANYKKLLSEYQNRCKGLRLSYVPGTILHHWHGSLENRKYRERWQILTHYKFNPNQDIFLTSHGLVSLTRTGNRLQKDLYEYFLGRTEDT